MVIPFIPGTNALWDPWQGSHNGKGLTEDAFDNATKVILNQDFVSGLTQPAKLLDYFPYLSPAARKLTRQRALHQTRDETSKGGHGRAVGSTKVPPQLQRRHRPRRRPFLMSLDRNTPGGVSPRPAGPW